MAERRYIVGIDLGTTNSVVAFLDTEIESGRPEVFPIPQLLRPGAVESRTQLPSFLYIPAADEFPADAIRLPWNDGSGTIVGAYAQSRGAEVPARVVVSAKSWLSLHSADRTAPILPWGAPDDVAKISPLDASTRYLEHIRSAWDHAFPQHRLGDQEVLLTVPASFDAAARELTVHAATAAGIGHATVLEEPQAAFYAWIDTHDEGWRDEVRVGDTILVCDVGGGTTDFTLIRVEEHGGQLVLDRAAVGDHILLGGDNMDLTLAFAVRERLARDGTKLDEWQFRGLVQSCREAKEQLLERADLAAQPIAILGRGRKVIGGALRTEIRREDVERILIEGFVPQCALTDAPAAPRRTALQEIGLPYASDAAITRHLAQFLGRQSADGQPARPTAILFNGGVMRARRLRDRLVEVVAGWFDTTGDHDVRVLAGGDPEHAVARGAVYYGLARRGRGVRIRGGIARSYYLGIEAAMPAVPGMRPPLRALCVVPRGLEEGSDVELPDRRFGLVVGDASEFRLLSSSTRSGDAVGDWLDHWDEGEIVELPPLETTLAWAGHEGDVVPVRLQARVNELGVLELWCTSTDGAQRWKLEFNVRSEPAAA